MSFPDFHSSSFKLTDYVLLDTHPRPKLSPALSTDSRPASSTEYPPLSAWAGLKLHPKLVESLEQHSPHGPQPLHQHILRAIQQVHHLELVLPSGCGPTVALVAGLVTVAANLPIFQSTVGTQPVVLVLCLSSVRAERTGAHFAALAHGILGAKPYVTHDATPLTNDLETLSAGLERPRIVVATLGRAAVLRDHRALILNHQLAILTLDLRPYSATPSPITHHAIAQLRTLLDIVGPHTQLIVLFPSAGPSPSSTLATLISRAMDRSIRANLISSSKPGTCSIGRLSDVSESAPETGVTVTATGSEEASPVPHRCPPTSTNPVTSALGPKLTRPISGHLDQLLQVHQQKHKDSMQWSEIIERFQRAGLKPADFAAVEHKSL